MGRIEKTVFISYRRKDLPWARAIYQDLTSHGFDAFFDFQSINSGDFSQLLIENIKARAHFVLLLTPSALERCENPNDWLRKEIETAIDYKRNIIPLMLENFDFGTSFNEKYLTGKLILLKDYNGLRIHSDYFEEAMDRMRQRYLNTPLDAVIHPLSEPVRLVTIQQQSAANIKLPPEITSTAAQSSNTLLNEITKSTSKLSWITNPIRTAQASFYSTRAKMQSGSGNFENALQSYHEVIRANPKDDNAYLERGDTYQQLGNLQYAIKDFSQAIQINPLNFDAFLGRGFCRQLNKNYERAIKDFSEAIRIKPNDHRPYNSLGHIFYLQGETLKAFSCYQKAIALAPFDGTLRASMVRALKKLDRVDEAYEYELIARSLIHSESEYNKACLEAICGNLDESLELLKTAIEKGQVKLEWAQQDPDFENLQHYPRFKALVGL